MNPLGVYLLRDAKTVQESRCCIFKMQYNCYRLFFVAFSIRCGQVQYLLFQPSEFFDGILKIFQFVFIWFVWRAKWMGGGGGGGAGQEGEWFIHIHFVSWDNWPPPFFLLLYWFPKYKVVSTMCEKCLLCYFKGVFNLIIQTLYINLSIFLVLKVQYAYFLFFKWVSTQWFDWTQL